MHLSLIFRLQQFFVVDVFEQVESGHQKNWPHSNQLIQRLKNIDILDGVSLQSNEDGSNTDSGRGPSEVDGLLPVDMHSASRLSPSRPSYITGTVPTVTVVPIKPCLVTDSSRLANHVGRCAAVSTSGE